jgi:hypothetical protein
MPRQGGKDLLPGPCEEGCSRTGNRNLFFPRMKKSSKQQDPVWAAGKNFFVGFGAAVEKKTKAVHGGRNYFVLVVLVLRKKIKCSPKED